MKKKLLFVVSGAKFFLSHRLTLAMAAVDAGFEVHVATPDSPLVDVIRAQGLTHHSIRLGRSGKNPLKELSTFFELWRLYRSVRPDVVHHITLKPILYGGIAARCCNIPAVVNSFTGLGFLFIHHTWWIRALRWCLALGLRISFKHPNLRTIFQNRDDQQQFIQLNLLRPKQVTLIRGSGVSMSEFMAKPENENDLRVVLISRMLWDKGIGEFVLAAKALKKTHPEVRFILVGGVDLDNPAAINESQLLAWQNEGSIEWWGEHQAIAPIMQESNIICLPSYREGLPKVLVEAAASARAIVTTDVPGCRDVVKHGENGLVVPLKNPEALAIAIQTLIEDPSLRQTMGKKGRLLVENDYALECVLQQTLTVYQELINSILRPYPHHST